MQLQYKNIILRDTVEQDLEDYIRWNTTETEWQNWDAPWENDSTVPLSEQVASAKRHVDHCIAAAENNVVRKNLEICIGDGTHIGWINRYYINDNFSWTQDEANMAIGIDIPAVKMRGCGYGENAMKCFIQYLSENGVDTIYTQTWSGNERMIRLAEKLGFTECDRKAGIRVVDGKRYDAVTFVKHSSFIPRPFDFEK